jgi:Peptidase family M28/PA domain
MKKILSLLLISTTFICQAQTDNAAKYGNFITKDLLKKHLTIIASDEFEGRETGTEGQRKAAAYIEKQFENTGLKKAAGMKTYQQLYPLFQDSIVESSIAFNKLAATNGSDFIIPLGANESKKFNAKKIVFAGYGIADDSYNDYANLNVKGKVVLMFLGEPKKDGKFFINPNGKSSKWTFPGISEKLAAAKAKGAVGVFFINPSMESFSKRMIDNNTKSSVNFESLPTENKSILNYALLSHAFAKSISPINFDSALSIVKAKDVFSLNNTEKKLATKYVFKKVRNIINASNVIGIIEGTDKKDEYVFMTGHYDHLGRHDGKIYYGADDDGSGTCGVIAMAEAFAQAAKDGFKPRRTLVFMTVSGEEKGLWGSEYYSDHPIYPLDKTTVDLNTDMVGRVDTERLTADSLNYVYVVGHDKISSDLPIINEGMNNKYTNLVLDYKFDDPNDKERIYFRSDHYNFARKGVPVLFFYDGMLKADYHKPTDTVDKINFELYEKRVRMIFYTAWEMANRDAMLTRDKPLDDSRR